MAKRAHTQPAVEGGCPDFQDKEAKLPGTCEENFESLDLYASMNGFSRNNSRSDSSASSGSTSAPDHCPRAPRTS